GQLHADSAGMAERFEEFHVEGRSRVRAQGEGLDSRMGTSNPYGGPKDGLVPSWLDKPTPSPSPPGVPPPAPVPPGTPTPTPQAPQPQPAPEAPPSPVKGGSLRGARTSFTRFAGTGSRSNLDRSLSDYVRGAGGAG